MCRFICVGVFFLCVHACMHAYMHAIVARVKKKSAQTKIIISSIIIRQDQPNQPNQKINETNKDLIVFCEKNLIEFLLHENIDSSCLGKGKLHPNKKGKAYLAKNFIKCIKCF